MKKNNRDEGYISGLRRQARRVAMLLLIALAPMTMSCYGRFPLTRAFYDANSSISDSPLVHSIVMWVFIFFPVYAFGAMGDVFIFNLLEFWTGEIIGVASIEDESGHVITLTPNRDGSEALLTLEVDGIVTASERLFKISDDTIEVRDEAGRLVLRLQRGHAGEIHVTDSGEKTLRTFLPGAAGVKSGL